MRRPFVISIKSFLTDNLVWKDELAVRVIATDQEELDRISDEILNSWLEKNPNRPACYVQSQWRPNYSL